MIDVRKTRIFVEWLRRLRDLRAQTRIRARIDRLEYGLFGDAKYFDGIGELRIDYGPGYRVYFVRRGNEIVVLLCGGDKGSQRKDIAEAKRLAKEVWNDN
jgi:putative addiction module killer protein